MAIVFLALNGQGLGHLVRATIVCGALQDAGERPLLFSQGIMPLDDRVRLAGKRVPSLWKADAKTRANVGAEITTMARLSLPAIVAEDTHPNPIVLPRDIRRVLFVRPTSFDYLCELRERHGDRYDTFLLCDAPQSPTWPYSPAEDARIASWQRWHVVGPLYRSEATDAIDDAKRRYAIDDRQRVCVFSMGGGGQHPPYVDAERFVAFSTELAQRIRARDASARLLFVRGPYFPAAMRIRAPFEVIDQEPRLPALLAAAHGAVVRAGFNTTWECIAARTPFVAYEGITHGEPTGARLARLAELDLVPPDADAFWSDDAWRSGFRARCAAIVARFPGCPAAGALRDHVAGARPLEPRAPPGTRRVPARLAASLWRHLPARRPFVIRVDDVVSMEPALEWLLALLHARGMPASLEIIPYLTSLRGEHLDAIDPDGRLLEVSQHGYAHVAVREAGARATEFSLSPTQPPAGVREAIVWGRERLRAAFGQRFRGGFSPAFDALPGWLPDLWRDAGGTFVSLGVPEAHSASPIPILQAGFDIRRWRDDSARAPLDVLQRMELQARRTGHAGIIVHAHRLRHAGDRQRLLGLLEHIERRRWRAVPLSRLAGRDAGAPGLLGRITRLVGSAAACGPLQPRAGDR